MNMNPIAATAVVGAAQPSRRLRSCAGRAEPRAVHGTLGYCMVPGVLYRTIGCRMVLQYRAQAGRYLAQFHTGAHVPLIQPHQLVRRTGAGWHRTVGYCWILWGTPWYKRYCRVLLGTSTSQPLQAMQDTVWHRGYWMVLRATAVPYRTQQYPQLLRLSGASTVPGCGVLYSTVRDLMEL